MKRRASANGFTLLEIVIAVAIFAVIASIVFPAFIQFLDVRERIIENNERITDLQKMFLFMERDLRFASNRVGKDDYGDSADTAMVIGDDVVLELTAFYPDLTLAGTAVPRRVRWRLDDGDLIRAQFPVMDPTGDTRRSERVLLSGVEGIEFEVSAVEEGRTDESSRWNEADRLPDLVKVLIEMDSDVSYERAFTVPGGDTKIEE